MAGIGQSSTPSSDQSTPWNSQFSMGRSTTIDNHSNMPNKYLPVTEKRRLMPEENGIMPQNMYQYNRQSTGFQSSNLLSNDRSYLSSIQSNLPNQMSSGGKSALNYNMYQRTVGADSCMYPLGGMDMSSSGSQSQSLSKQGYNLQSSTRLGGMSQFLDTSSTSSMSHSYMSQTPHRTISSGSMNPNVPAFNGQAMSKNRPGSYNLDSHSVSLNNQWDTQIGNFDSSEFPSLKPKQSSLLTQMSTGGGGGYNYSAVGGSAGSKSLLGQINYQMMTKSGLVPSMMPGASGGGGGEHSSEFSIQQEDFPALPVAQNPITCAESQRSSSASGMINTQSAPVNSSDNSSQSHNSSIVDSSDYIVQKQVYLECPTSEQVPPPTISMISPPQLPPMTPQSYTAIMSSSINNSSQPFSSKSTKKIFQGPNNYVANIPEDMVSDAFGLIGLIKLLSINDTYDHLNLLAPGLETLSLNKELDSTKDIYQSYVSPLSSNCAGRPHDMDYPVPKEYRIRHVLMDRLADPLPEKLSDETLFWIFYNLSGEECQLVAAKQLIMRQWRFNKRERFWLTREPNGVEPVIHSSFERGNYIVWDPEKCKKSIKPLTVYYKDLESISGPVTAAKLQLPFCCNYGSMKRPISSSVMMMPGRLGTGINNSGTGNKSMAAFLQHQQLQQSSTMVIGNSDTNRVPPISMTMTANHNSSTNESLLSQLSSRVINNGHPQQQQHHVGVMQPSSLSSSSSLTTTTTSLTMTTTTSSVTLTTSTTQHQQ